MSSTGQATSASYFQLIIDATADYTKITGIDLLKSPLAATLEQSSSLDTILQLLQGREKALKESLDSNRRLFNYLSPVVKVLHAFSRIIDEPVSVIPIPLANALLWGIDILLDAASGVTSIYDALLDLFECLGNFLKRLEIFTTIPATPTMTDIIVEIMTELLSVLALATKKINLGRFETFTKRFSGYTETEAVFQRLDRLTQDEARMTVTQTLCVVHGLVGNMRVVMEDGKATMDSIRRDLVALHQTLNKMNKMNRDQLQWDVQHWFSPPDPSTNHNFVRKARHRGTAAWFFESSALTEWKSRGSLLWIHGKPGAGKSTLLSAIIQDIEGMQAAGLATIAYYYFDFREVRKQDCYGLLSSLVSQLAAESDSFSSILSRLYSDHSRGPSGIRKPDIDALKKCVTEVLSLPEQAPTYIIIDAVDECPNFPGMPSAREEVLEILEELVDLKLPNVHLCVASRPETDIRVVFEPLTSLKVSLHDESGQKEDIIEYIKFVVRSDWGMRRWKEEHRQLVINTLSDRVDGMFRWVVCQVDRLRRTFPASIRSVLNDLPKTLDETYGRTLLGIDEEKREYAQRLFRCLSVSIRPLRVEEIAEILAVQFDKAQLPTFNAAWRPENAEEAVISACSSLISIVDREGSQVAQFSHFSVKEFLTSERLATAEEHLSYYHILPEPAHTILAQAGLSVLLQLDDKNDKDTIDHFPLASYAARHWVDHAQFGNVSSHIRGAMEHLFDPAKSYFAAWIWLFDIDRDWTEPMSKKHPTRPEATPLYYAALCGFCSLVEHLIAVHSLDVNSRGGSHTTSLHAASVKGHLDVTSLLLKNGADPNSRDDQGRAPIHRVSQGGQLVMAQSSLEISRLLLNSGADVSVTDEEDRTPLHAAARSGNCDIAELLLESGASIDAQDEYQWTPLYAACSDGKLDISRLLIDRGSDTNSPDHHGYVPLHMASRFGQLDVARLLLDRGCDVDVCDAHRWTPLHLASNNNGYLDIVKLLVERGANIDSQTDNGNTPLDLAVGKGYLDITRLLIENGAPVSARGDKGWTPLHTTSFCGHLHVVKFLLECGVDIDVRNGSGQTPLFLASCEGKLDVARFLIERGADIHAKDDEDWNPLLIASVNGRLDIVRMFIDAGIAVDVRNGTRMTPLALASSEGKVEVAHFLIERGADLNVRDAESWAPLHCASGNGHLDTARLLLDHGVDVNIQCGCLCTPLHMASVNGHLKVAELLVQRGASVDVLNDKQQTPLQRAVRKGNVAIARLLIDHGANPLGVDSNGHTLLHVASNCGHLEVVKLLLQRGADVDVLNRANKTAAELALKNGQAEVAKFIEEYKTNANIENTMRSATLDAAQYSADEDGKDEGVASLTAAAAKGDIDLVKSLLERGVNINGRNAANQSPLDRAAANGKLGVVRLLLEQDAEVDSCDELGWTALHFASRFGRFKVSLMLINHGANVNARKQDHWTPLHLSVGRGSLRIVKLLLEHGADVRALNGEGEMPYELSVRVGNRDISYLLREHGGDRAKFEEILSWLKYDV